MSLDDIIKSSRKTDRKQRGKPATKNSGAGKVVKKSKGNTKIAKNGNGTPRKAGAGGILKKKKNVAVGTATNNTATQRLVQKLVNKALAQKTTVRGGVTRKINKMSKRAPLRGVQQRSKVIKKKLAPRTETVVVTRRVVQQPARRVIQQPVRRVIQQVVAPRRQVIREVVVQQPARSRYVVPAPRFNNRPQQQVVYVEKRGRSQGGGNFQNRRFSQKQRRQNTDPFYEPQNFLQRY